ncbi:MAG: extracellular solute-binding protein [Candidatus Limivivens sp.]|nr:extracellular solute-binding protein [Candidatus Limivivens sp.]
MKKRNVMALFTAMSLVITGMTGITGYAEEGQEKTVLRQMVWGSIDDYIPNNDIFLANSPEYADTVELSVELGGSGDADVAERFRLMLASGEELPDLIRLNYTQFAEFAAAGVLYDLGDAVAPYEDDIIDAAREIMMYDGTYYAAIHEIKPKIWFYRSDIFAECGIDVAEVKTLDDFIAAAQTVSEKYPDSYLENYGTPLNNYDLTMMLCATGGTFCDEEGNYHCASDEGVRQAFENLKKLKDSKAFSDIVEWSADWQAAFSDDTLISQLLGGWMKDHLINWTPENAGKWAVAPWPEEIAAGSESGGGIWVIPKDAPHAELAAEVLAKYTCDAEIQKAIYDRTGKIPPLKSAAEDEHYLNSDYFGDMSGYFAALEKFSVYPYNPSSSQELTIIGDYLTQYLDGAMDLDTALENADADMKNQIGNPYQ